MCGDPVADVAFLSAIASWVGCPQGAQVVEHCAGPHEACAEFGGYWDHFQSCKWINGRVRKTVRHDGIRDAVTGWLRQLGLRPHPEPLHLDPDGGGKHPDIEVFTGRECYLIDVVVVHATGPGYARRGRQGMVAVEDVEKAKKNKFKTMADRFVAELVPFALDSTGAWGTCASRWADNLLRSLLKEGSLDDDDVEVERRRLRYLVAHTLHRGNAATARDHSNRNRGRASFIPSQHFQSWR